ncbi:MAG TPA: hypothetical protein VMT55_05430 [Candidatus Sulfotelmatobacter sp.]|nr:hypothetical protein [Candidatus Sulfotelmatobacter sp.]
MAEGKKSPKFHPKKYDVIALEAEYLNTDDPTLSKFFRARQIPQRTGTRMAKGWPDKWKAVREKGLKIFQNKLAKEIADQAELRLTLSKGIIKVGAKALFPDPDDIQKGLKPQTAREAAQLIAIGDRLATNITDNLQTAVQIELQSKLPGQPALPAAGDPSPATGPVVSVSIRLPSNGREVANG